MSCGGSSSESLRVVLGRDNPSCIKLGQTDCATGHLVPLDLSDVTRIVMRVSDVVIDSDLYPGAITWDAQTISLRLGAHPLLAVGVHSCRMTYYTPTYPTQGFAVDPFQVLVIAG